MQNTLLKKAFLTLSLVTSASINAMFYDQFGNIIDQYGRLVAVAQPQQQMVTYQPIPQPIFIQNPLPQTKSLVPDEIVIPEQDSKITIPQTNIEIELDRKGIKIKETIRERHKQAKGPFLGFGIFGGRFPIINALENLREGVPADRKHFVIYQYIGPNNLLSARTITEKVIAACCGKVELSQFGADLYQGNPGALQLWNQTIGDSITPEQHHLQNLFATAHIPPLIPINAISCKSNEEELLKDLTTHSNETEQKIKDAERKAQEAAQKVEEQSSIIQAMQKQLQKVTELLTLQTKPVEKKLEQKSVAQPLPIIMPEKTNLEQTPTELQFTAEKVEPAKKITPEEEKEVEEKRRLKRLAKKARQKDTQLQKQEILKIEQQKEKAEELKREEQEREAKVKAASERILQQKQQKPLSKKMAEQKAQEAKMAQRERDRQKAAITQKEKEKTQKIEQEKKAFEQRKKEQQAKEKQKQLVEQRKLEEEAQKAKKRYEMELLEELAAENATVQQEDPTEEKQEKEKSKKKKLNRKKEEKEVVCTKKEPHFDQDCSHRRIYTLIKDSWHPVEVVEKAEYLHNGWGVQQDKLEAIRILKKSLKRQVEPSSLLFLCTYLIETGEKENLKEAHRRLKNGFETLGTKQCAQQFIGLSLAHGAQNPELFEGVEITLISSLQYYDTPSRLEMCRLGLKNLKAIQQTINPYIHESEENYWSKGKASPHEEILRGYRIIIKCLENFLPEIQERETYQILLEEAQASVSRIEPHIRCINVKLNKHSQEEEALTLIQRVNKHFHKIVDNQNPDELITTAQTMCDLSKQECIPLEERISLLDKAAICYLQHYKKSEDTAIHLQAVGCNLEMAKLMDQQGKTAQANARRAIALGYLQSGSEQGDDVATIQGALLRADLYTTGKHPQSFKTVACGAGHNCKHQLALKELKPHDHNPQVLFAMGTLFESGCAAIQDKQKALKLYSQAAHSGFDIARKEEACLLCDLDEPQGVEYIENLIKEQLLFSSHQNFQTCYYKTFSDSEFSIEQGNEFVKQWSSLFHGDLENMVDSKILKIYCNKKEYDKELITACKKRIQILAQKQCITLDQATNELTLLKSLITLFPEEISQEQTESFITNLMGLESVIQNGDCKKTAELLIKKRNEIRIIKLLERYTAEDIPTFTNAEIALLKEKYTNQMPLYKTVSESKMLEKILELTSISALEDPEFKAACHFTEYLQNYALKAQEKEPHIEFTHDKIHTAQAAERLILEKFQELMLLAKERDESWCPFEQFEALGKCLKSLKIIFCKELYQDLQGQFQGIMQKQCNSLEQKYQAGELPFQDIVALYQLSKLVNPEIKQKLEQLCLQPSQGIYPFIPQPQPEEDQIYAYISSLEQSGRIIRTMTQLPLTQNHLVCVQVINSLAPSLEQLSSHFVQTCQGIIPGSDQIDSEAFILYARGINNLCSSTIMHPQSLAQGQSIVDCVKQLVEGLNTIKTKKQDEQWTQEVNGALNYTLIEILSAVLARAEGVKLGAINESEGNLTWQDTFYQLAKLCKKDPVLRDIPKIVKKAL